MAKAPINLSPSTTSPFSSTITILSASPSKAIPTSARVSITLFTNNSGWVAPQFVLILYPSGSLARTMTSAPNSRNTVGATI